MTNPNPSGAGADPGVPRLDEQMKFSAYWRCKRCGQVMFSPTTGLPPGRCAGVAPGSIAYGTCDNPMDSLEWTPLGDRLLCTVCHGNGVVKIHHGVSVCDHCHGDYYEPDPAAAARLVGSPEEDHENAGRHAAASGLVDRDRALSLDTSRAAEVAPGDGRAAREREQSEGIVHTHRWAYNALVNAMFCRCGDRINCDHRLPDAIKQKYTLTEKPVAARAAEAGDGRALGDVLQTANGEYHAHDAANCGHWRCQTEGLVGSPEEPKNGTGMDLPALREADRHVQHDTDSRRESTTAAEVRSAANGNEHEVAEAGDGRAARLQVLVEEAFRAGYHCQWIRAERRYIFDPQMKPGDPDGAYAAWRRQLSPELALTLGGQPEGQ